MQKSLFLAGAAIALFAVGAAAETLQSTDVKLKLGQVTFKSGKTLDLSVGIGSALFHAPGDPADEFYAITDRGPNIDCSAAEKITGMSIADACGSDEKAKLFPRPDFVPSIVKVKLNGDGSFVTTEWIPLKDTAGNTITINVFDPANGKPVSTKGFTAAVLLAGGGARETVTLEPSGENALKGTSKNTVGAGASMTLTIKTAEGKSGQAKFGK